MLTFSLKISFLIGRNFLWGVLFVFTLDTPLFFAILKI